MSINPHPPAPTPLPSARRRHVGVVLPLAVALGWILFLFLPRQPYQAESTRRMAQRLADLAREVRDPHAHPFATRERIAFYQQIDPPPDVRSQVQLGAQLAHNLLLDGQTEAAFTHFTALQRQIDANAALFKPAFIESILSLSAIAALRLGEQENCIARHSIDSCLLPIRGSGVHEVSRGARAAVATYLTLLERTPTNLNARWLLNIAAMSAGMYPDGVPTQWRIPLEVFRSDFELPRFFDVAPRVGLDVLGLSGGTVLEDFDRDGFIDVMASSWGLQDQLRVFRNTGTGTFSEQTAAAGLTGVTGGLNLVHADYDNDGFADVLVLRGAWLGKHGRHPNSLLRNNGDGTFADVTEAAGLLDFHPTQTASWADYDGDGWLDLFVGNESVGNEIHPCRLFHSNRDGTFTDVATSLGLAVVGYVKAVTWGDYDNDGRPDLYLSRLGESNLLFRNEGASGGQWRFRDVTREAGVGDPLFSFPAWFWDYNNDGWLDLFVSGYPPNFLTAEAGDVAADYLGLPTNAERPRLYRNNGDGTFREVSRETRLRKVLLAMGSNFGDLDNDGWLDFYLGTGAPDLRAVVPNRMFRNAGGEFFQDVTTAGGVGHLQKGHAVAFADLDNDGDQDIYEVMGGAFPGDVYQNVLFENPGHGNSWLTLQLEGVRSNRSALGARIRVDLLTSDGERTVHATVSSGGSFGSSSLQQELGLGTARTVRRLTVTWPTTGQVQTFEGLAVNQVVRIREGDATITTVSRKPFTFAKVGK